MIAPEVQRTAVSAPTLDEACKIVQDALGVETGDVAGIHFSGTTVDEDWPGMDPDARWQAIEEYVRTERAYLEEEESKSTP